MLLVVGMAQAQDVYFAGNHNGVGKIWKNDSLVQSITDTTLVGLSSLQIAPDGNIYSAGYSHDSTYSFVQGRVWLNDNNVFVADTNSLIVRLKLIGNQWFAAGISENQWEGIDGLVWQDGEVMFAYSDSVVSNMVSALAIDTATGDVYVGGRANDMAAVWKNDTVLWQSDEISAINDIVFDGVDIIAAGINYADGFQATLWRNDSVVFSINDSIDSEFTAVAFYDGSIFVGGFRNDTLLIWQDGEVLYSHPTTSYSEINTLTVNESGVYYAGQLDGVATVWKDGEVLYEIEDCDEITALVVMPSDEPTFTLTVEADSTAWGTVTGGGMYHYGDTATIEAIANAGCTFLYWNDSITDNPRDIVITQDTTFIAHFQQLEYVITATVSPEEAGTVMGGGAYHYGDTVRLEAAANGGFAFERWNDNVTDNPRDVVVTQDSSFVAFFVERQYTITVVSDHPAWGSVTGGGTFNYGDTIQIAATAYLGFGFAGWTDGNSDNPRTVVVTDDQTYTAHFEIRQCVITTQVTPEGSGTVNGGGTYDYGETIHLVAHSNTGYIFDMWDDGILTNPRSIFVEGDATYTAVFTPLQYEITTECDPVEGGAVTGAGIYNYGEAAVLTATPNVGYMFICWQDGIITNPRTITVTQNAHYKAKFHYTGTPQYTVTVIANDPELGTVTGSGTYSEGDSIQISAIPVTGAMFTGWDDGNTDNPRTVVVTGDLEFKAIFTVAETFTIIVRPENAFVGSTYGSGTYPGGTRVNIGATPNQGFYFAGWQDGDMNNPRTITVTEDAEYVAYFSQEPTLTYNITVYYDESQGFVLGAGTYAAGATATLAAIPADGYQFVKWSDDSTVNPKEVVVDHDIVLAAFFNGTGIEEDGVESIRLFPNPTNDIIHIEGLEEPTDVSIYNAIGVRVKTLTIDGRHDISVSELPAGLYLVRIGNHVAKFVKK